MRLRMLWLADRVLCVMFQTYAKAIGLYRYHLPDMEEIARVAHDHYNNYNNHLRGGDHMEVGNDPERSQTKRKRDHIRQAIRLYAFFRRFRRGSVLDYRKISRCDLSPH